MTGIAARESARWQYRQRFVDAGLLDWYDAGFGRFESCQSWSSLGFTIDEAVEWRAIFCKPLGTIAAEAAEWKAGGHTPKSALAEVRRMKRGPRTMRTR